MRVDKGDVWASLGISGFIALVVTLFGFIIHESNKESKYTDSFIGKEVVLHGDTLMVFDHNSWQDAYVMSNGMMVDDELVQSLEIIEE
ncbi:hypothetical protein KA005_51130 [bacterium]|nr:hypothetical protein [bacterium]